MTAAMENWSLGMPEMMIFAILTLILFGARKLPTFRKSLGKSLSEFRIAKEQFEQELRRRDMEAGQSSHADYQMMVAVGVMAAFIFGAMVVWWLKN